MVLVSVRICQFNAQIPLLLLIPPTLQIRVPRSVLPWFWVRDIKCLALAQPQAKQSAGLAAIRAWSCKVTLLD